MDFEHMDFVEAVEHLASRVGIEVPRDDQPGSRQPDQSADLLGMLERADRYYREQLRRHADAEEAVRYLKGRGVSGEIAARFGLGYAPAGWDNLRHALGKNDGDCRLMEKAGLLTRKEGGGYYDRFRHRIMFPIQDHRGRVVAFGGRILDSGEPKYLNSPETPVFHKGAELYGLYAARGALKEQQTALVVEGYMDVVALAQFGIDYAVATLGTATTTAHMQRVYRHCAEVVFCFDGDRAGLAAAARAMETALGVLQDGRQASFLFLPEGQDPDSLVRAEGAEGFEQRIQGAVPLPDYLLRTLTERVDLSRLDGRARLVELARPLLKRIPEGLLRELIVDRLATLARTDRATLAGTLPRSIGHRPVQTIRRAAQAPPPKSTIGVALGLLVQHPYLARIAGDVDGLADGSVPGSDVLRDIVHLVREHPGLNTAAILERFRGGRYFKRLSELARAEQLIPDEGIQQEFQAQLAKLRFARESRELDELLDKAKDGTLSADEKSRLPGLLKRHAKGPGRQHTA
jgi:DNA primase